MLDLLHSSNQAKVNMEAEEFATLIKEIHGQVREHLKQSSQAYKSNVDAHKRSFEFKEGDLVMVYLHKEIFHANTYNKIKQRKFSLCRVLKLLRQNAYRIELLEGFSIIQPLM